MPGPHFQSDRPKPADRREVLARARQLRLVAARAIDVATATVKTSCLLHARRQHWRRVWSELQCADLDYMAVCCAYCDRVRTRVGVWGEIPSRISEIIHGRSSINITHGICPDCQPGVFAAAEASAMVAVEIGN